MCIDVSGSKSFISLFELPFYIHSLLNNVQVPSWIRRRVLDRCRVSYPSELEFGLRPEIAARLLTTDLRFTYVPSSLLDCFIDLFALPTIVFAVFLNRTQSRTRPPARMVPSCFKTTT